MRSVSSHSLVSLVITKLHSAVFAWSNGHRLEIEWARGRGRSLSVLPEIANLVSAEEELDEGGLGVPAMCWRQDAPALFDKFNCAKMKSITLM